MLVFISWSGVRSRYVAEQLRAWLKDVLQQLDPWVSSEDIRQGSRWNIDVARRLQEASFGILCLTKENLNEPWLLFEAGALAKALEQANVCPYLIDLKPTEVNGPLVQFQAARATEDETRRMVQSINKARGEDALPVEQIDRAFRKWWPDLEAALARMPQSQFPDRELRSERALLEELLERIRRNDIGDGDMFTKLPISLFEGADVKVLLQGIETLGGTKDENDLLWSEDHRQYKRSSLDGLWSTRWKGGSALSEWVTGVAQVQVYGENLYAITHDGRADCLIVARQLTGRRFAGRYINLEAPQEVLAWVGRQVDVNRIDGLWTQGRWDLRR